MRIFCLLADAQELFLDAEIYFLRRDEELELD